jgi:hypothetical protein
VLDVEDPPWRLDVRWSSRFSVVAIGSLKAELQRSMWEPFGYPARVGSHNGCNPDRVGFYAGHRVPG